MGIRSERGKVTLLIILDINEKSSELVKILHALKQKTATPGQPTSQKPVPNPNAPTGPTVKPTTPSNNPGA